MNETTTRVLKNLAVVSVYLALVYGTILYVRRDHVAGSGLVTTLVLMSIAALGFAVAMGVRGRSVSGSRLEWGIAIVGIVLLMGYVAYSSEARKERHARERIELDRDR